MNIFLANQDEALNHSGHQAWHRVTVRDFGDSNLEISVMPYETWSEPCEEDLIIKSKRGEGDRERSAEVAARRAKRRVRHLCKMLKARYMMTLTTKEVITDVAKFQKLFQEFVRRIRLVANFQYVATHELQQRGALHLHVAVATRQDYKLLWSVWQHVVGEGQGRVHVSSGNRKASVNQIAAYISKYIAKSFETGALNKRRYWASKGIGEPIKTVHLLRKDWSMFEVLRFLHEICYEHGCYENFIHSWLNYEKGLFWVAIHNNVNQRPIVFSFQHPEVM